ncbi:MAG: shikimate dehydrogenase [Opitutales bacterium]|nr:shikimate dehydrogenase [Opitutales bacterium]MDG1324598.1 shikimate dehydrogenase [Opitutales bacterium]
MNELNFKQELTAAFGQPISENPTQVMIEAAYRHHNLDWRYLTIEVGPNDLEAAVQGAKVMGFQGFNCTIPHKVNVIQYLDGLGESASLMGAVNCVVRRDGKWIGENTDGKGFVSSLNEITDPKNKKVVIFGAGGAARAISVEVALAGANHITIVNRSAKRGEELTTLLQDKLPCYADFSGWDSTYSIPTETDIVINATSIGLFPDIDARLDFDLNTLSANMVVADVIPNPPATNLVRDARAKGCKVIDGLAMLVSQGVIGVKHWTGVDPDPSVMRAALEEVFG